MLALTNNIYFIGGESYGASIEHSFLTRKQGLFQLLSLILLVGGLLFALPAFEVQAASTVTPKTVMYVEVNNHDFNNVGKYTLAGTNQPAFDMGIIFAANINYDTVNKNLTYI